MTIYVDDFRVPARVGRISSLWSHLAAGPFDDLAELHTFAAGIGLKRSWFQAKGWPRDHYDVTDSKRAEAIAAGAVPITWRQAGEQLRRAVEARRNAGRTLACAPGGRCGPPSGENLMQVASALYDLASLRSRDGTP